MAGESDSGIAGGSRGEVAGAPRAVRIGGWLAGLAAAFETERARWFLWLPVVFGFGIAAYFALPFEPPLLLALLAPLAATALRLAVPRHTLATMLTAALLAASIGFAVVAVRAAFVGAPVLAGPLSHAEVRGFVERLEPRAEGGERLTLLVTALAGLDAVELPRRVRIRVSPIEPRLVPGDAIAVRATLAPPAPPALPGDYDFARYAYFLGIGGVGYATAPPVRDAAPPPAPFELRVGAAVERFRDHLSRRIVAVLPGETGAIAAALITGERGGITDATNGAYRDSGLFHILSISGLHMAIMGGAVFWVVRLLLALAPGIALRYPIKKWAAAAALLASFAYLAISGGSFATLRSFVMIAIMFLAVMLDRPALALRNVAASALLILLVFPESLLDAGFQMSFAAVVALVAAYEALRERMARDAAPDFGMAYKVALFFGGIVLSTLVASLAVAPFAAFHFHKSQQYAVIANLLAVPLTNLVVMPAALATLIVMPLGLEALPLTVMGLGIDAMTAVARQVAALPGAVVALPAVPAAAFVLILLGGLWLTLWQERWRLLGFVAIAAGLVIAPTLEHPDILAGRDGALVAVRGADGRLEVLASPRSEFEIKRWLEHDGDGREAGKAVGETIARLGIRKPDGTATHRSLTCDAIGCTAVVAGATIAIPRHPAAIAEDCHRADLVVLAVPRGARCHRPAAVIDFGAIRDRGTHAIYVDGPHRFRITTVADARGDRPWSRRISQRRPTETARFASPVIAAHDRDHPRPRATSRVSGFAAPGLADALASPRPEDEDDGRLDAGARSSAQ